MPRCASPNRSAAPRLRGRTRSWTTHRPRWGARFGRRPRRSSSGSRRNWNPPSARCACRRTSEVSASTKDDATVDADGTLLQVSLPKLEPGRYRVTWRVLSVDTHVTEGDFTFEVVP